MLNKRALSIATLVSNEESRFTLNGVLVTPDKIVETDGHQLIVATLPTITPESFPTGNATKDFKPFLLPKKMAQEIERALPKKSSIPVLECAAVTVDEDGKASIVVTDLESTRTWKPNMSGNFPDYERVMPKLENAEYQCCYDARLLVRVLNEVGAFSSDPHKADCILSFQGPDQAVRIDRRDGSGQEITAVVMPMRGDEFANTIYKRRKAFEQFLYEFKDNLEGRLLERPNEEHPGVPWDEDILAFGAALYGQVIHYLDREAKAAAERIAAENRSKAEVKDHKEPEPEAAEEEPLEPEVVTTISEDQIWRLEGPNENGEYNVFEHIEGDAVGEEVVAHVLADGRIGIHKSYAGDREALKAWIRRELERPLGAAIEAAWAKRDGVIVEPDDRVEPTNVISMPVRTEQRPDNWNSLSPAEKAWVTRRQKQGGVAVPKEPKAKAPSLKEQLANLTELLKSKLADSESGEVA